MGEACPGFGKAADSLAPVWPVALPPLSEGEWAR